MWLPTIGFEIVASGFRRFDRRFPLQAGVRSMPIVIVPESNKFYLQIRSRPEQQLVQTLAADGADQSFDQWVGPRNVRNCFDFLSRRGFSGSLPIDETDIAGRDRN